MAKQYKIKNKKIILTCRGRKCGHKWIPNPRMWRNRLNPVSARTLKCPDCGLPNRVKKDTVRLIWKYNF